MGKNATHPKLIKSIEAVYKLLITEKEGVIGELVSPYNLPTPGSVPPSPASESSATSATKRRAQLSAGLKNVIIDEQGFEDVTAFWNKSVDPAFEEHQSPNLGWPEGELKTRSEVHTWFNLITMSDELNKAADKATKGAEDEAAATKAAATIAEVTKAASIAVAAEAATHRENAKYGIIGFVPGFV
eukprot:scaffold80177_cov34-Attheya_sp.AAC.2